MKKGIILFLLLLLGCEGRDAADPGQARLLERREALADRFQACERDSAALAPALLAEARCLYISVPENPEDPGGTRIDIKVMVIPSIRPVPDSDAFTILVGGPGEAATEAGLALVPLFADIRRQRDILLVDQRGTGSLSPFDCNAPPFTPGEALSLERILREQEERLSRCLAELPARAQYYTTDIAVQDLEAVRDLLGYSRLNLWGGSYGSRAALAYLGAYPDAVRTVVLDGMAPPGIFPIGGDPDAALDKVLGLCEENPDCASAFPELRMHLNQLLERLETPELVDMADPGTGAPREDLEIGGEGVRNILFLSLYSRELTRLLPLMIEEMYRGDYRSAFALADTVETRISEGMFYSVICNEDMALLTDEDLEAMNGGGDILGSDFRLQPILEACEIWPRRMLDPSYFDAVTSDKPVLILSGEQDPVTPPRWGERVARTLTNSRHLRVQGVGHITSPYGCIPGLIADFVEAGELGGLDTDCIAELRPRPFFLSTGGSAAASD